jgi:hypothetical protein
MTQRYALILLLILLAGIGRSTMAQGLPGYIVPVARPDTLRGYVANELTTAGITFYAQPGAQGQLFGPNEVRGYGFRNGSAFISRIVRLPAGTEERQFVQPLLEGPACLYLISTPDTVRYALQPPVPAADTLIELTPSNWHLLFNRYLSGCPTLDFSDLDIISKEFERRWLGVYITKYNECKEPGWKPARRSAGPVTTQLNLVAGTHLASFLSSNSINPPESRRQDARPAHMAALELRLLRASGWWLALEAGWQQVCGGLKPYVLYTGTSLFTGTTAYTYRMQQTILSGSLGRTFRQPGQLRPFVGLTIGTSYQLSNSYTLIQVRYSDIMPSYDLNQNYSDSFGLLGRVSAGVWVPTGTTHDLQVRFLYGIMQVSRERSLRTSQYGVQIGYTLLCR